MVKCECTIEPKSFVNEENGDKINYFAISIKLNGAVIRLEPKDEDKSLFKFIMASNKN